MSLPKEVGFAVLKIGDGATPEVFKIACGIQDVVLNHTADTRDRQVRDCTKPGETPNRRVKSTGQKLDITATGLTDADHIEIYSAAVGKVINYKIELLEDDNTDTGNLLGTLSGAFMMTANNMNLGRENDAGQEITLANDGPWTYVEAP